VYSPLAMLQVDEFCARLLADLDANGIEIGQFHAEYGVAQMELAIAPSDPVSAADLQLLARQTIHAAARATGLRASFAPLVVIESVGNGWHLHTSVLRDGTNLLSGGDGPAGMTPEGEAWVAGMLRELPALAAVGGPSLPSQIRRRPGYFAAAYAFWGVLNREAALRFVPASQYVSPQGANVELKASDASGNPYLLLAAVIGAGLAGIADGLRLPEGIEADPGSWDDDERAARGIGRLPDSIEASIAAVEASQPVRDALGDATVGAWIAVRRGDEASGEGQTPEEIVESHRWRY
jgi:glutamine synthetase